MGLPEGRVAFVTGAARGIRPNDAPHRVALVRADATLHKGKLLERPTDEQAA
jgi:hypothetical protein